MARLPQIAETAQRGILPSANLTSQGADANDFGGQIGSAVGQAGAALQDVSQSVEAFELARAADQRRLRDFTLEANLVKFQSEEAERLDEARRNLSGGGWEFQRQFVTGYDQRAAEWLTANGVQDDDDLRKWSAPLARLRASLSGEALGAEFAERERFYTQGTTEALDLLRTNIVRDPNVYEQELQRGVDLIRQSGLSGAAKEAMEAEWGRTSRLTLGQAILENYGGHALADALGESIDAPATPPGPADVDLAFEVLLVKEGGLGPNGEPLTSPAGARGVAQVMEATGPEAARLAGLPWDRERWLNDTEYNRALGQAYFANRVREFGGDIRKGWAAYNAGARWVREAEQRAAEAEPGTPQADWFWQLNNDGRTPANRRETQNYVEANDRLYAERSGQMSPGTPRPRAEPDPRLEGLAFQDRQRLGEAAGRDIQARQQAAAAAARAEQSAAVNALEVAIMDGTAGEAEIAAARANGTLTDAQDIARLTNAFERRQEEAASAAAFSAMWNDPNFAWDPYSDDQREAVDAAYQQSGGDLGSVQALVDRTGIVPPTAVSAMRGALLANDPMRVGQAASLAANIIARRPNAFTGVEGGEQIVEAANLRDYYINTLGLTDREASDRLMRYNDPERRDRLRPNTERENTFRTELARVSPQRIVNALPGSDGRILAQVQREAVLTDYNEIAMDHFRRYGDEGAAGQHAQRTINRLYGISANGTFTKFPPENVYPAVGGSHDYIYEQAAAAVRAQADGDVTARDVFLLPVPTLTAEAWRQGQPPAYQIGYVRTVDGERVYDTLPLPYRFNPPQGRPGMTDEEAAATQRRARETARFRENAAFGTMVP